MADSDTELGSGFAAFVIMLFGAIIGVLGLVTTFVFWPAGIVLLGIAGLCIIGGPVVGVLGWVKKDS